MKKLSVCIPTYNRLEHIKRQVSWIDGIKNQFSKDIEFIISNNASTDGTTEYLDSIKAAHPEIIINNNKNNLGLIGNLRHVTEIATGEYIWFIGDDDRVIDGTVNKVLETLSSHTNLTHIFMNYRSRKFDEIGSTIDIEKYAGIYDDGYIPFEIISKEIGLGANMFLTANIYSRKRMLEANKILNKCNETDNWALPLGWSLYCSNAAGMIISEACVEDCLEGTTWSNARMKTYCRDMSTICVILSRDMGISKKVGDLLVAYPPIPYPEVRFIFFNKDKKVDNYVLKWMWKNYTTTTIKHFIQFPFYSIYRLSVNLFNKKKSGQ